MSDPKPPERRSSDDADVELPASDASGPTPTRPLPREDEERGSYAAFMAHSGPLPSADEFGGYEAVLPGAADRILRMAEKSLEESLGLQHRQLDLDQEVTRTAGKTLAREQWLTFIVAVSALAITVWLALVGRELAAFAAAIGGSAGTLALARHLLKGTTRGREIQEQDPS